MPPSYVRGVGKASAALAGRIGGHEPRRGSRVAAVKLDAGSDPKKLTLALQPAQIITGRVTYADSGKPVPHPPLVVSATNQGATRSTSFEADGDFRGKLRVKWFWFI